MTTRAGSAEAGFWGDADDDVALCRYRALVETIDDGIYQLDAAGQFVAVNDVIVETTGYDREELLGEHVSMLLTESDVEQIEHEIARRLHTDGDDATPFELAVQTADGEAVPFELRLTTLVEDGEFQGTIGVARDLSEREQRIETLESAQASYDSISTVLDEADIGVFVLDDEFRVAWADETVEQYFGLDREAILGRKKRAVIEESIDCVVDGPEQFSERVLATYDDNSYVEQFECQVAGEDGDDRWLEHYSRPIESGQYAGGRIELYYDVTDRKQSEDALQETEAQFQELVDAVEEYAIFRLDTDGQVISWNEGAREIKGYEAEEIVGQHFSTFYTEDDRAAGVPEGNLERATADGSVEDEGWRLRKDGTPFWANVTITAVRDDDGSLRGYLKVTRDMTDRRERERELETELQRILGRISDAFFAVDEDARFTHVNGRAEELLERPEDELLGERLWDAFPAMADLEEVRASFETARACQEATSVEFYDEPLGLWVEANLYPSETGVSVYFRDVTERKRREQTLERYETIVETVDDGIYALDADARFVTVNDAFCELTGYDREELLGRHASVVHSDEIADEARRLTEEVTAGDRDAAKIEHDIVTTGGETIPIETRLAPLVVDGADGRCGVVRDVSDRVERERKLEESERRYRTLVEYFPNGAVGLYDEALNYSIVGGQLLDDLGHDPEDVVGTSIYERYPDELVDGLRPNFEAVFDGEASTFEIDLDERILLAQTLPVRNAADEIYAGMVMVQDVTEREEYRRKLETSNERLEQFAYSASHDLKEPLRMVTSYLQLLERRHGDELEGDAREFLAFAVDGADRMHDMIEALLEYSRVETRGDPFEAVELAEVLADVRDDLQVRIAESDAEIRAGDLPCVRGDAHQLRQLFQNLLSNAIEYSGDEPPEVEVTAERDGEDWRLAISDRGIGIDPDEIDRIFDVFQRLHTREEHPGTGIGLALCQRIVERHGGTIDVESEPGQGSTFSFRLPPVRDDSED